MDLRSACLDMLETAETVFRRLESSVPPPQWVPWMGQHNYRYLEKLPTQALIQKAAREISGLRAFDVLLSAGMTQEVGMLIRSIDELNQDISFIALGLFTGSWTSNHDAYLNHFWSEDEGAAGQPPVPRKTIRAYNNRALPMKVDVSRADATLRTLHQVFSDFIHGRSSALMAMVEGPPARFQLRGSLHPGAIRWASEQAPSYFYRALISLALIAKVTGSDELNQLAYEAVQEVELKHAALLFP